MTMTPYSQDEKRINELLETYAIQLETRKWQRNAKISVGFAFAVTLLNLVHLLWPVLT